MLKIQNLHKTYDKNEILKDINLSIKPGCLTTLLGKNGCGKSTFLKILSGYELPSKGTVTYNDIPLNKVDFPYIHDIFFVHENIEFAVPYSIGEFIEIYKEKYPAWNQEAFNKMLSDRQITLDKNYNEYSRGQKMQIMLIMAIASNAKTLLLDEITSVIDVYGRKYFLDILRNYADEGNTVVITTNIINELEFYTDELIIIRDKEIVLNKNTKGIPILFSKLRKANGVTHAIFEDSECIWAGINSDRSITYIIPSHLIDKYDNLEKLLDRRQSTLEDIFIYFFGHDKEDYENVA